MIVLIALALVIISATLLINLAFFPRLKPKKGEFDTPMVSILIPARDEAENIGRTLRAILRQNYSNFEVIVLNDNSQDETGDIVHGIACCDQRLTVIDGQPLPPGWMGKSWACHQMSQVAHGDYLLFTDADVMWQEDALENLMQAAQQSKSDLYTVWPTQITETPAERLTVPLMAMAILSYLPIIGVHFVPIGLFGAANGQCMLWRRRAYMHIGGHESVRNNVLEDVTMARYVKRAGLRLRMADGNNLIECRMYDSWQSVRNGFAKNILAGYGGSVVLLLMGTIFHLGVFVLPWLWLVAEWALTGSMPVPALLLVTLGITIRALTAAFTNQRVLDSLLMPISVILMTRIALQSIWWHYNQGGPSWKGRVVSSKPAIEHLSHG